MLYNTFVVSLYPLLLRFYIPYYFRFSIIFSFAGCCSQYSCASVFRVFLIHDLMDGSMDRMDTIASNRFLRAENGLRLSLLIIWDLFLPGIIYELLLLLDVVRYLG
jgi:hypothetical protein